MYHAQEPTAEALQGEAKITNRLTAITRRQNPDNTMKLTDKKSAQAV